MCEGGIYDHLGGGFSRYSVDERWLVPHFEKMLYDNAQLLELLALAQPAPARRFFRERAEETVGWLAREMTTPDGAFCASLDADSEGEEGKFYVWSRAEIEEVLGPNDAEFFAAHYDVTTGGNFEGHNILNRLAALRRPTNRRIHAPAAKRRNPDAQPRRNARRLIPSRQKRSGQRRRCMRKALEAAPSACGRASTTRSSPTGTA